MTAQEFEARIVAWAQAQPGMEALVQLGSRAQPGAIVDAWSDWDYQLIVRQPKHYHNRSWPAEIAPCWSAHFERTERGVTKLSAVFAGGFEADFVLLSAWQARLACHAMRHPGARAWFPPALRRGIRNLRLFVTPGYRVVLGGAKWENRYAAMRTPWPEEVFSSEDLEYHTAAFWRHAVWVAKKILRGEVRAAARWHQREVREHLYALLAEEARLAGRAPRPEARQAERWLGPDRLRATAAVTGPEPGLLARALRDDLTLFQDVTVSVAGSRGFAPPDHSEVDRWLRGELRKLP